MRTIFTFIYKIYALFLLGILLLITIVTSFPLSLFGEKGRRYLWYVFRFCNRIWFLLVGIRIQVEMKQGEETFNKRKKYIFIANHSSYMDTQLYFGNCPCPFKILGAKEYAKVPIFGFFYKQLAVLVNRNDKESRQKSISQLNETLEKGWNVLLLPEGGIKADQQLLSPFYKGAFSLAKKNNLSILPIVFPDTLKRVPNGSLWNINPGICRVIILPEIKAKDNDSVESFKKRIFQKMNETIENANSSKD